MNEILKMIEEVDPNDTAKLDEIDARVWCWLNENIYVPHPYQDTWNYRYKPSADFEGYICGSLGAGEEAQQYTRSRDALKSIRPEGWIYDCEWYSKNRFTARFYKLDSDEIQEESPVLPTEELAELHAIIQVVAYERSK